MQCSVCLDLLCEPVPFGSCGHTFCEHCLAQWVEEELKSGKGVCCPECRTPLQQFGKVNLQMREMAKAEWDRGAYGAAVRSRDSLLLIE